MAVKFGDYTADPRSRTLDGPGGRSAIAPRAFDILMALIVKPGEVVSKDDLFKAAWPGLVVEENTLQVHMSALRKALPADFIVTVHGRGYRYAGPAPSVAADATNNAVASLRRPAIAVLPFANLSDDPAQQFLSDGIAEDITDRLTRFRQLAVVGQHSAFQFRTDTPDLLAIRDRLKADFIVTGSVRRVGGNIRIAARLTDTGTGLVLWAERFDRPVLDVFAVQDELTSLIAANISKQLEIEIGGRSVPDHPSSFACYEWLLRGHWHFNRVTRADTALAIDCYEKALALEPRNGEALASLAACRSSMWLFELDRRFLHEAIILAHRGCEADPDHAFCHAVLGLAQCWTEGPEAGEAALERAVQLNPSDWKPLGNMSLHATFSGKPAKARALVEQVKLHNPILPLWVREFECISYFQEERFAEVLPGVEAIPEGLWDAMYALSCYGHLGMREKAHACLMKLAGENRSADFRLRAAQEPYADQETSRLLVSGIEAAMAWNL